MKPKQINLLDHIEQIIALAKEQGLEAAFFEQAKPHLETVAAALRLTEVQACLFSLVLENAGREPASIGRMAESLNCGRIQLLKYMDDFEVLEKRRMIRAYQEWSPSSMRRRRGRTGLPSYNVPLDVIKAVRQGRPYKDNAYHNLSPEEFFSAANELLGGCQDGDFGVETLWDELKSIFMGNRNIAFVKDLRANRISINDAAILLCFCCAWIEDDVDSLPLSKLIFLMGVKSIKTLARRFKTSEHILVEKGFLETASDSALSDGETWRLSLKAHDTFLADINLSEKKRRSSKNMIPSTEIKERLLFHPEKIVARVEELTELLMEDNFSRIIKRLMQMNMRTAFTCIFSGPPGTGKTETAYQIARITGRDIFFVDISETKSMWFGESEKRIKSIFDRYKGMLRGNGPAPILLFNEADAVFGKRQELSEIRRGPAHTENAIQNIILQEMENLEGGILIATTNMKSNLDKAFERRFLYKLEFEKPNFDASKAIWRNFIPDLLEGDAEVLARRFDFSGGQIENIARKNAVSYLLTGNATNLESLITLCEEEKYEPDSIRIGF